MWHWSPQSGLKVRTEIGIISGDPSAKCTAPLLTLPLPQTSLPQGSGIPQSRVPPTLQGRASPALKYCLSCVRPKSLERLENKTASHILGDRGGIEGRKAKARKQESYRGEKKTEVASNSGQVAPWHKCPEITFFLGCRELNLLPRRPTPLNLDKECTGEEPGSEGQSLWPPAKSCYLPWIRVSSVNAVSHINNVPHLALWFYSVLATEQFIDGDLVNQQPGLARSCSVQGTNGDERGARAEKDQGS
jgi:hypothetical protein